jgi:ABC-2 type transport system ATP-binding protein
MITIHELSHHFGVRPVLQGINAQIQTGEVVVILGPNGSGKSTLLGCIAGTIWPVRGHVAFDDVKRRESIEQERLLRQKVVYLPDDTWLPIQHTGREFLLAVGRLYDIDEFRLFDHADRLLALFHLESQGDALIQTYSTGQRKKIALASALITESQCLLLDEPFSGGLDPIGILALKNVLKNLAASDHITLVLTTPVPELVEELADRVLVLRDGQLISFDSPQAIKQQTGTTTFELALEKLLYPDATDVVANYFGKAEG